MPHGNNPPATSGLSAALNRPGASHPPPIQIPTPHDPLADTRTPIPHTPADSFRGSFVPGSLHAHTAAADAAAASRALPADADAEDAEDAGAEPEAAVSRKLSALQSGGPNQLPSPLAFSTTPRSAAVSGTPSSLHAMAFSVGSFTSFFDVGSLPSPRASPRAAMSPAGSALAASGSYSRSELADSEPVSLVNAPLSYAQLDALDVADPAVPIVVPARAGGILGAGAMARAVHALFYRHPMLRASFDTAARTYTIAPAASPWAAAVVNASSLFAHHSVSSLDDVVAASAAGVVPLSRDAPAWRADLYTVATEQSVIVLTVSRLVADETGVLIMMRDLLDLFGQTEGQLARSIARAHSAPPDYDTQYPAFAANVKHSMATKTGKALFANWYQALGSGRTHIPSIELPRDTAAPKHHTPPPACFSLSRRQVRSLVHAARGLGVNIRSLCLSAYAVLLHRYTSGQDALVISTRFSGRPRRSRTAFLVAPMENQLPVLVAMDSDAHPDLAQLVAHVHTGYLFAREHQEYPARMLREKLAELGVFVASDTGDAAFAFYHDLASGRGAAHELLIQGAVATDAAPRVPPPYDHSAAKVDPVTGFAAALPLALHDAVIGLSLASTPHNALVGAFHAAPGALSSASLAAMADQFVHILLQMASASPDTPIAAISLLTEPQRRDMLQNWASGPVAPALGADVPVTRMFEAAAAATPHALALAYYDESCASSHPRFAAPLLSITYAELNNAANTLATRLVALGVARDVCVAVMIPRSIDMVVAVLAVLKAGGCYVPLDPEYPDSRLAYMIATSAAPVALVNQHTAAKLDAVIADADDLDVTALTLPVPLEPGAEPPANLDTDPALDALVYTIFTSGSTGLPKGVAMLHSVVSNLTAWQHSALGKDPHVTLQFASLSFDVHFQELFSALSTGGSLVLVSESLRKDIESLLELLHGARVQRLFLPFVALQAVCELALELDLVPSALTQVITAGEQLLSSPAVRAFFTKLGPHASLHNHYGPSESHVVTALTLDADPETWPPLPPIGFPISRCLCYVVDKDLNLLPPGVPGELLLGGPVLAAGYLNAPDLTAQAFIPDTLTPNPPDGARLYRTGDLVRFLPSGQLEYLARISTMVKIRGHRVEVAEVEVVLAAHPAVQAVVVQATRPPAGSSASAASRILVAYIVPTFRDRDPPARHLLVAHASASLPSYMIPTAFVFLDHFPLTPSGKVARKALPPPTVQALPSPVSAAPESHSSAASGLDPGLSAPDTLLVQLVAGAFADVLNVAPADLGLDDSFFDLGGHSLSATQVVSRLRRASGSKFALSKFYNTPTVRGMAALIQSLGGDDAAAASLAPPAPHVPNVLLHADSTSADFGVQTLSHNQRSLWYMDSVAVAGLDAAAADGGYTAPWALLAHAYTIAFAMRVDPPSPDSPVDVTALASALTDMVAAHAQLHMAYVPSAAEGFSDDVVGVVKPLEQLAKELASASNGMSELVSIVRAASQDAVDAHVDAVSRTRFSLTQGHLFHARIIVGPNPDNVVLAVAVHHVAVDLWSLVIMMAETLQNYADATGAPKLVAPLAQVASPPAPETDYALHSVRQAAVLDSVDGDRLAGYWKQQLDGVTTLDLPTDFVRPAVPSYAGGVVRFELDPEEAAVVRATATSLGATEYVLLLALFKAVLAKSSGQSDITVGTPMSGRTDASFDATVGYFINMVPVRDTVAPSFDLRTLVSAVKVTVLDALDHQDYPFALMVNHCDSAADRDASRSPLFQAAFVLQKMQIESNGLGAILLGEGGSGTRSETGPLTLTGIPLSKGSSMYDITLVAAHLETGGLALSLEYNSDIFAHDRIQRMAAHFSTLTQAWSAAPDTPLRSVNMSPPDERALVLESFNDLALDLGPYPRLLDVFVATAAARPGAIAIHEAGVDPRARVPGSPLSLTFADVEATTAALARWLVHTHGVGPDSVVGVCMHRSASSLIAMIAVMRAGAAYMPMDYHYPIERLQFMLADSEAPVCLFHTATASVMDSVGNGAFVAVNTDELTGDLPGRMGELGGQPGSDPSVSAPVLAPAAAGYTPSNLAYVIYTSGTTGKPKGVCIEVSSLHNLVVHMTKTYQLDGADAATVSCGVGFDACVIEMWPILYAGGTFWPVCDDIRMDVDAFVEFIIDHALTCCLAPTPLMEAMFKTERALELPLRYLFTGGDVVHSRPTTHRFQLINLYGPTENTVISAVANIQPVDNSVLERDSPFGPLPRRLLPAPPIGFPVTNQVVYVLDEAMEPVALGVWGELYVGGAGLAREYLKLPDKTAAAFVANPFATASFAPRLYKTGDIVRFDMRGELYYAARKDHQVKIRGFRIELGEIETVMSALDAVTESAVVVADNAALGKHLVAFVVVEPDSKVSARSLRVALAAKLPDYMVPKRFVIWSGRLPLTANGKTDRRVLSAHLTEDPTAGVPDLGHQSQDIVSPASETHDILVDIWREVLGVDASQPVSITWNFFEAGGHSLAAAQYASRVRQAFGVPIAVGAIFDTPTIAGLAQHVDARVKAVSLREGAHIEARDGADASDAWLHRPHPLSLNQASLWYYYTLNPVDTTYNVFFVGRITSAVDLAALQTAMAMVVRLHPVLVSHYSANDAGVPLMHYDPDYEFGWEVRDATSKPADVDGAATQVIDLESGPLTHVTLFREPESVVFVLVTHHIVCDLWSMVVILEDLAKAYDAVLATSSHDNDNDNNDSGGGGGDNNMGLDAMFDEHGFRSMREASVLSHEYNRWQHGWLASEQGHKLEVYWEQMLSGRLPTLSLPEDHPRSARLTSRGGTFGFDLGPEVTAGLRALNATEGTTMFMTMLAVYGFVLQRFSGQDDVVVGTLMACRNRLEVERLVGFLANPVALVLRSGGPGETFEDVLLRTRELAVGALTHQEFPFGLLLEKLVPEREPSRSPVFQALFVFERPQGGMANAMEGFVMGQAGSVMSVGNNLVLESVPFAEKTTPYEIQMVVTEHEDTVSGFIQYNADIFDEATIASIAGAVKAVAGAVAAEGGGAVAVGDLRLLSPAEEEAMLAAPHRGGVIAQTVPDLLVGPAGDSDDDDSEADSDALGGDPGHNIRWVHVLFEKAAKTHGDAVAVTHAASATSWTYRDLDGYANQIGRYLRGYGVFSETVVALVLPRGPQLIAGMLATWKAGGGYLPVDPSFPGSRIQFMLGNARPSVVLTVSELAESLGLEGMDGVGRVLCFDTDSELAMGGDPSRWARLMPVEAGAELANVIYTSGTSGTPKGIRIPHATLLNFTTWFVDYYQLTQGDVSGQMLGCSFDPVFAEIWPILVVGGRVAIADDESRLSPTLLQEWWRDEAVTVQMMATPMTELVLGTAPLAGLQLRAINTGGDKLKAGLPPRWVAAYGNQLSLHNMYGPTETTIGSTVGRVSGSVVPPPIGFPIANTFVYVLDAAGRVVPPCGRGELYIGGAGVTHGYLGNELADKTAAVFVEDVYWKRVLKALGIELESLPGTLQRWQTGRMYATGDVVRMMPNGELRVLGRVDSQVKIRGFRIELAEIEVMLRSVYGVADVVVVARESESSGRENMLVAYVVPERAMVLTRAEVVAAAAAALPEYMVPRGVVVMSQPLPLTANGKVDVRRLPGPTVEELGGGGEAGGDRTVPRTEVEVAIAEIWRRVLGLESEQAVGVHANFFELGGYSLLAAQIVGAVEEAFGVHVGLRALFDAPTVAGLGDVVAHALGGDGDGASSREAGGDGDETPDNGAVDLGAEVVLPVEIHSSYTRQDDGAVGRQAVGTPNFLSRVVVFLTGATGFVGTFLLNELLESTSAEVRCLVRAETEAKGRERLNASARKFGVAEPCDGSGRVSVVCGTLGKAMFGLGSHAFSVLARSVDVIVHNGACVNFVVPYSGLKAANVGGTVEVLRLSCFASGPPTPVHYISTLSTLDTDAKVISETDRFPRWERLVSGYSQSKWVAEQMVLLGREARGLDTTVYRLGRIAPSSRSGIGSRDDLLMRLVKAAVETKFVPEGVDTLVDLTPVDYAARLIVTCVFAGDGGGRDYHVLNPRPIKLSGLWKELRKIGYELYPCSVEGWYQVLLGHARRTEDRVLRPVLEWFEDGGDGVDGLMSEFPSLEVYPEFVLPHTQAVAQGLECPAVDGRLLGVYVERWVDEGWWASPKRRR